MARRKPSRPDARALDRRVPLEREVQGAIMTWLVLRGCRVFRRNVAGAQQLKGGHYVQWNSTGQADLWGTLADGTHYELEVKRPGERPSEDQIQWLLKMNGVGADRSVAFWAASVEDVEQVVTRVMQGWRIVFDHKPRPGDFRLEPPAGGEGG